MRPGSVSAPPASGSSASARKGWGVAHRSSRPDHCPHATPTEVRHAVIEARKHRQTYRQISQQLEVGCSTIARLLRREGVHCLASLEPPTPVQRYTYPQPGAAASGHQEARSLSCHRVAGDRQQGSCRAGWEYLHVAIDDHSRVAFSAIHQDKAGRSAYAALIAALRYDQSLRIGLERVLTANASCYRSWRFARLCRRLGLKPRRIKPYAPQTNGKAERFIQTTLRERACAQTHVCSEHRANHLPLWLHHYP